MFKIAEFHFAQVAAFLGHLVSDTIQYIYQFAFASMNAYMRIVCKYIIKVRNALLKHITKTVNYVVLNCGVRPFFTIFGIQIFLGVAKS